jgi:uncharacterized protein YbjT (DUF2867 family)
MSNKDITVLLYGATGTQQGPAAQALIDKGYTVRILTRNPDKAAHFAEQGAEIVQGDMSDLDRLKEISQGVNRVALLIPAFGGPENNPFQNGVNAITAAKEAGVELIVYNTSGSIMDEELGRPMLDMRLGIKATLENSGIPHIIIAPNAYMENLAGPWTAGRVANDDTLAYPITDDARLSWIASQDVGHFVAKAIEHPELANSLIRINGPEHLSGPEMAAAFTRGLGREISWHAQSPEEFGESMAQFFGPEAGKGIAAEYGWMQDNHERVMHNVDMAPILEKLPIGELTTLEEWVRQHAGAFQAQPQPSEE